MVPSELAEEHVVANKLYLAAHANEVSQPVPVGDWNLIQLVVSIESASTLIFTSPVVARIQFSADLDLWEDLSSPTLTFTTAPKSATGATSSYSPIVAPYVRVRFTGGGGPVLLGASIRFGRI